jgi:hypothetical protein
MPPNKIVCDRAKTEFIRRLSVQDTCKFGAWKLFTAVKALIGSKLFVTVRHLALQAVYLKQPDGPV